MNVGIGKQAVQNARRRIESHFYQSWNDLFFITPRGVDCTQRMRPQILVLDERPLLQITIKSDSNVYAYAQVSEIYSWIFLNSHGTHLSEILSSKTPSGE